MRSPYCTTVEVLLDAEDKSFILRNALALVAPFPSNLDSGLDSFGACVHRKYHVEAKGPCNVLRKSREDIVVESTTAQRQSLCLFT